MRAALLLALVVGCASERATTPTPTDHPGAPCGACHRVDGPAQAPPVWHVLDCCGEAWTDCGACHTTTAFQPPTFDHDATAFPLDGAHRTADGPLPCARCHADLELPAGPDAAARCHDCHAEDRPPVSHSFASDRCADCHTTDAFRGAAVAHPDGVPLTGPHQDLRCEACHLPALERATPRTECACCHTRQARAAPVQPTFPLRWLPADPDATPDARTACGPDTATEAGHDCAECHEGADFTGGAYAHPTWPLGGAHARPRTVGTRSLARCDQCHLARRTPPPTECVGCHPAPERADHPAGQDCARAGCHTEESW
jgi:hypothetical protein